jgi:hypothetical protein
LEPLRQACERVVKATDPVILAIRLVESARSRDALRILDWGFPAFGDRLDGLALAADICVKLDDILRALGYVDRAVSLAPEDVGLRWQRVELRHFRYRQSKPDANRDPEGDLLLQDYDWLKQNDIDPDRKVIPYKQAASVYRQREDLHSAANELYGASQLEWADLETLHEYGQAMCDCGYQDLVLKIADEGIDRSEKLVQVDSAWATLWRAKFEHLKTQTCKGQRAQNQG